MGSSPHWASAGEGQEPHKEDWDDFAGKLRLGVCLYPAPLGEEGPFLPQPVPSSQLSYITGLCLNLLILWRRLTCGLEVGRVACLWLAKACVSKDALAPDDFLSVGLASRTDAQQ